MNVSALYTAVTLLIGAHGSNMVESATGFFFQVETSKYLVSNRHVFSGESLPSSVPKPDSLILLVHTNPSNLIEGVMITLPIRATNNAPLWLEYPAPGDVDLAMLPVNETQLPPVQIRWLSPSDFPPDSWANEPGHNVFIMGYPQAFHDRLFNLPIVRNGIISSPYGVPFEGHPYFFVDAKLHPGTSGSPVFSTPVPMENNMVIVGSNSHFIHFIGVNSGELNSLPGQQERLGLNAVWYPTLLVDIHNRKSSIALPPAPQSPEEQLEKHGYSGQYLRDK